MKRIEDTFNFIADRAAELDRVLASSGRPALDVVADFLVKRFRETVPSTVYEAFSRTTGYAVQSLQNAVCVCRKYPKKGRPLVLTVDHLSVLAGADIAPTALNWWADKIVSENLTVRGLRALLGSRA
jgi:hypothetical protein